MALVELETIGFLVADDPTRVASSSKLRRIGVVESRRGGGGEGDFGASPGFLGSVHVFEGECVGQIDMELGYVGRGILRECRCIRGR